VSQKVIELNGKRYDATTGALLGENTAEAVSHLAAKQHQPEAIPAPASSGKNVDGFFRRPSAKPATHHTAHAEPAKTAATHAPEPAPHTKHVRADIAKPGRAAVKATPKPAPEHKPAPSVVAAPTPAPKPKKTPTAVQHHAGHANMHHEAAKPAERHAPQHSKTLMRAYVRKPEVQMKRAIKPQAPAEIAARPASSLARKRSVAQVDPGRAERAQNTAKHNAVRRFHASSYGSATVKNTVHHLVPAKAGVPVIPVKAAPLHQTHHHDSAAPAKLPDIFENAIRHAQSHEQPMFKHPKKRRRFHGVMAGIAAFLILGGFITYLNLPNIQLRIASVEAGFHARMPGYQPTGYALSGGVKHDGGTVTMRFVSGDSSYQIAQQASSWDSQSLLDNTLALSGPHKTIEKAGRTIYVYGDGANASWVTGSVRYDITGSASLSPEELASIAASM
jgi:hypothetical protein